MSRNLLPFIVAALLLGGMATMAAKPGALFPKEEQLEQTLQQIIIPRIDFRDVTVQGAVDYLLGEARRVDPRGRGIRVIVRAGSPAKRDAASEPSAEPPPAAPAPFGKGEDARTSVTLSKVPLLEALRYVTGLANLKLRIHADGASIVPLDEPDPMFTRDFTVSRAFKARLQVSEEMAAFRKDPRKYLIAQGVGFSEGGAAILTDDATRLTVRETRAQLDLINELLNPPPNPPPIPVPDDFYELREALMKRLRAIVLPKVDLKNIPLSEAVAALKSLGMRYDSSRSKRDINVPIVFKCAAAEASADAVAPLADQKDDNPNITYTASKVSLFDALEAVAKLGGYEVRVEPYATVVAKPLPEGVLVTREWKLPPTAREKLEGKQAKLGPTPEADEQKQNARAWLTTGGVTFNSPASAIYIVRTNRLIVRDTPKRVREFEESVEKMWKEYREEQAAKGKKESEAAAKRKTR
jgi:hypothetical protein